MTQQNPSGPADRNVGRQHRIDEARRAQPLAEIERKALKSARRGIWTQEQVDLVKVLARDLDARFGSE